MTPLNTIKIKNPYTQEMKLFFAYDKARHYVVDIAEIAFVWNE